MKNIFKIVGFLFLVILILLIIQFYRFSTPKSDESIKTDFAKNESLVYIKSQKFKNFEYRVLETQKEIDTLLPTIVFIHGSIGSAVDFKRYLFDVDLNEKANLISYDRIGYGTNQTGNVQESIAFEVELLEDLTKELTLKNTVLVGYSYGGPIALASHKQYKKIVLLAPAVYSKVEPMPWALNLYKWKATRWLLPMSWRAASKEKLSHKKDLQNFERSWHKNPSKIISIHGVEDWIVPIENSVYLKEKLVLQQFDLVTLEKAGHGLVWSNFNDIKNTILQQLN